MKILVLSFYFRPDLCAGSFRTTAFINALKQLDEVSSIDVITTFPNRYSSYSSEAEEVEKDGKVTIRRVKLPIHKSDIRGQAWAFLTYARFVAAQSADLEYDAVFATSSRLMTAVLGAYVSRRRRVPLYLDIRDIFADTIGDVFRGVVGRMAETLFSGFEKWAVKRASKINLVSAGFLPYFRERYPRKSFAVLTNGIDDEFIGQFSSDCRRDFHHGKKVSILYAGNIGDGQALSTIVPDLAKELRNEAEIVVVGDGGRKVELEAAVGDTPNVEILPPVTRAELIEAYRKADVLFLHLGDLPAFEKVLPSKIFEYAASGKPILAGVSGYAAEFIRQEVSNAAVFNPGDVSGAIQGFRSLSLATQESREDFVSQYARRKISAELAVDVARTFATKTREGLLG